VVPGNQLESAAVALARHIAVIDPNLVQRTKQAMLGLLAARMDNLGQLLLERFENCYDAPALNDAGGMLSYRVSLLFENLKPVGVVVLASAFKHFVPGHRTSPMWGEVFILPPSILDFP
jgi:hypothetical protein